MFAITRIAVAFLLFALGGAPLALASDLDHADHETQVVGITKDRLIPTVKVIPASAAFGWLNYASRDASIEFEMDDVASKMVCRTRGPFQLEGDLLRAPRVASGAYATLCSLAPGEYDYRVTLVDSEKILLGKLVIEADRE